MSPNLTVLQVLPALESGGVERGTVDMVQAVAGGGGRAIVTSAGGRMVPQVERAGGRHVSLPLMTKDPVNVVLNAGKLARLIRADGVRLVHARSRAPAWSAWIAARRTDVPFVTTWHGVYSDGVPGKRLYNGVMAKGERVIAISRFVAARLEADYRVDPARVRTIPRGVDPAAFSPEAVGGDRMHRLAQAWRLPASAPVVMLPARLTRWKGAELLLDALALMPRRDVFCVLVGDDREHADYSRRLTARAERLGLAARLRLTGHCDDMPAALSLADLVVCPSLKPEPFGRTVIEAQAMGRRVIAANHGGAAETVFDGVTGWRSEPGNAGALAEIMSYALQMPTDEAAQMGVAGRRHVTCHYTTAAMQDATLRVYREVLGIDEEEPGGPPPPGPRLHEAFV